MAEKKEVKKDVRETIQKQAKKQAVETHSSFKVRTDLPFKKRSFAIGNKVIKLVGGEKIATEDYNLFNSDLKKQLFEKA